MRMGGLGNPPYAARIFEPFFVKFNHAQLPAHLRTWWYGGNLPPAGDIDWSYGPGISALRMDARERTISLPNDSCMFIARSHSLYLETPGE
jgi:hypothetical protein